MSDQPVGPPPGRPRTPSDPKSFRDLESRALDLCGRGEHLFLDRDALFCPVENGLIRTLYWRPVGVKALLFLKHCPMCGERFVGALTSLGDPQDAEVLR